MKLLFTTVACLVALFSSKTMAQTCSVGPPNTRLTPTGLQSIVTNNYVCVGAYPHATWNELHSGGSGSSIIDYKLGPESPTDPTATVGTYTVAANGMDGVITYNYTGGGSYSYFVQSNGGSQYYFCPTTSGTVITATIQAAHC